MAQHVVNQLLTAQRCAKTRRNKEMLEFKKYSSIENSFNREFMERIVGYRKRYMVPIPVFFVTERT